ncbi:MAG: efflux RND transporter periplasmic adaptor subunit [Chitinophagaceae bacterium]|nr:efflux RND transporter periplasmic adaptor subunit [Chitinophagaceae bacterium]
MTKERFLLVFGLLAGVVFNIGCKEKKKDVKPPSGPGARGGAPLAVEAFVVKSAPLASTIEVPGSLLPFEETEIRSEISGRIVQLNVSEGSNVGKGTLLVKLFDGDLQAQRSKLEVQLQIAEKTVERQKQLLAIGGISQQEYDLSELQINNLKADIQLVRVNIGKTEIRAPFDGRIGLRSISMGAYISPAELITKISQVKKLKLQFTVPEKYSSVVTRGQSIQFLIDGSTKSYAGSVIATESSIEENTRSLAILAVVTANDNFLVPGAFAKVRMILGREEKALMIPTQAVIPSGRTKQAIVYENGKAVFKDITTGIRDSANIQVISGLQNNDTVIITGLLFLRPNAEVKLSKVN